NSLSDSLSFLKEASSETLKFLSSIRLQLLGAHQSLKVSVNIKARFSKWPSCQLTYPGLVELLLPMEQMDNHMGMASTESKADQMAQMEPQVL
ncbi:MAG: hypothetical protein WD008_04435, partial [Balneolaceae bacterium]